MDREAAIRILEDEKFDRAQFVNMWEYASIRNEYKEYIDEGRATIKALDLAIEALKGDLHCPKCGTIVRDGRQYHDLVYRGEAEKHQLSGETSTIWRNFNLQPNLQQNQVTSKLESAEIATSESEESTMGQPKSKLDCIRRQQAIEAIEGVDWYHVNPKGELVHGSTSDDESWYRAEDVYKAIESLPPVTPTERTGKCTIQNCPKCGKFVLKDWIVCPYCGVNIRSEEE